MSRGARDRRWTPEQARAVLEKIERRGIPVKRFAEENGIGVERLYRWRQRLERSRGRRSSPPKFAEVTIRPTVSSTAIEIELSGSVRLRVTGETRVDDVVAILSRVPSR